MIVNGRDMSPEGKEILGMCSDNRTQQGPEPDGHET